MTMEKDVSIFLKRKLFTLFSRPMFRLCLEGWSWVVEVVEAKSAS